MSAANLGLTKSTRSSRDDRIMITEVYGCHGERQKMSRIDGQDMMNVS